MHLTKACNKTELLPYVQNNLTALGKNAGHIQPQWHGCCHESANFEKYVKEKVGQNEKTWDYLVSVGDSLRRCGTDALEVHPCEPAEAQRVIGKKHWSQAHLEQHYPRVNVERWVWIASSAMLILEGISPEHFELSQEGIEVVSGKGYRPG